MFFAGGWPGTSTFHLGTIGMAMGAPSKLVVCVRRGGGGGGTGRSKVGTLSISASVFYSVGHQCIR